MIELLYFFSTDSISSAPLWTGLLSHTHTAFLSSADHDINILLLRSVVFRNKVTTDWTEKNNIRAGGVKKGWVRGQELEEFIIWIVLRTL